MSASNSKIKGGRCCAYCNRVVFPVDSTEARHYPGRTRTIDHVIPFSVSYDDTESNKVVACRDCNALKADYPEEFFLDCMIRYINLTHTEKIRRMRIDAYQLILDGMQARRLREADLRQQTQKQRR